MYPTDLLNRLPDQIAVANVNKKEAVFPDLSNPVIETDANTIELRQQGGVLSINLARNSALLITIDRFVPNLPLQAHWANRPAVAAPIEFLEKPDLWPQVDEVPLGIDGVRPELSELDWSNWQ